MPSFRSLLLSNLAFLSLFIAANIGVLVLFFYPEVYVSLVFAIRDLYTIYIPDFLIYASYAFVFVAMDDWTSFTELGSFEKYQARWARELWASIPAMLRKGAEELYYLYDAPRQKRSSDVAAPWDMNFQTPASEIMTRIVDLHHDLAFFIVAIVLFVSWLLFRSIVLFRSDNTSSPRVAFAHHTLLEKVWTYIPAAILVLIASPSFSLLYAIDTLEVPQITVKVIGHQWYWSYETTDYNTSKDVNFDSYMLLEADLPEGGLRLLEVDNRLSLPIRTNIRLIITAADVLHSWAIPALGVKMDACPGRLNQVSLHINRPGAFFGQCSELCGINHSFMPIVVDAVTREQYHRWVSSQE
jgi:cytochrome c oxidase subunit 2